MSRALTLELEFTRAQRLQSLKRESRYSLVYAVPLSCFPLFPRHHSTVLVNDVRRTENSHHNCSIVTGVFEPAN